MKSCVLRSKKYAGCGVPVRLSRLRRPILCSFKRYTFYVCAPGATREQITPSRTAPPTFTKRRSPNSGHAKSPLQVCDDLLRQIPRNSVFAAGHRHDLEADCPYYCGQKMSRAADPTPARAAQGMATTSCCGKFLPDRGQKISCRFSLIAYPPCRTAD